jgi:hypothetical protein
VNAKRHDAVSGSRRFSELIAESRRFPPTSSEQGAAMDDKSINLWRQIESCRRRGKKRGVAMPRKPADSR